MNRFVKKQNQMKKKIYENSVNNQRTENDFLKLQTVVNVSEIIDKRGNDLTVILHQN